MPRLTNERPLTSRGDSWGASRKFGWPSWSEALEVPTWPKEVGFILQPHLDSLLPFTSGHLDLCEYSIKQLGEQSLCVRHWAKAFARIDSTGFSIPMRAATPFYRCKVQDGEKVWEFTQPVPVQPYINSGPHSPDSDPLPES